MLGPSPRLQGPQRACCLKVNGWCFPGSCGPQKKMLLKSTVDAFQEVVVPKNRSNPACSNPSCYVLPSECWKQAVSAVSRAAPGIVFLLRVADKIHLDGDISGVQPGAIALQRVDFYIQSNRKTWFWSISQNKAVSSQTFLVLKPTGAMIWSDVLAWILWAQLGSKVPREGIISNSLFGGA